MIKKLKKLSFRRFKTRVWLTWGRKVQPYLNALVIVTLVFIFGLLFFKNMHLADPEQGADYLGMLVNLLTMAATIYTARQIILMKKISNMEISQEIYKEDVEIRKLTKKMEGYGDEEQYGMQKLLEEWQERKKKKDKPFRDLYEESSYEQLREYAYHYEYLGQLIYRNELNFDLTFDTITFPDGVFEHAFDYVEKARDGEYLLDKDECKVFKKVDVSDEKRDIVAIRSEDLADQLLGIEYLYATYELRRKYNAYCKNKNEKTEKRYQIAKDNWNCVFDQMPL